MFCLWSFPLWYHSFTFLKYIIIGATAVKAAQLAKDEERKMKGSIARLVELQLKKLEIKMKHFEELESLLESEYGKLELEKQKLIREKIKFKTEQLNAAS